MVVDVPEVGIAPEQAPGRELQIGGNLVKMVRHVLGVFQGVEGFRDRCQRIAGRGCFAGQDQNIRAVAKGFNRTFDDPCYPAGAKVIMNDGNCQLIHSKHSLVNSLKTQRVLRIYGLYVRSDFVFHILFDVELFAVFRKLNHRWALLFNNFEGDLLKLFVMGLELPKDGA